MPDADEKLLKDLRMACRRVDLAEKVLEAAKKKKQFKQVEQTCVKVSNDLRNILRVQLSMVGGREGIRMIEDSLPELPDGRGKDIVAEWLRNARIEQAMSRAK